MPSSAPLRILLVEDSPADARLTSELLRDAGTLEFELEGAGTLDGALSTLANSSFDVILLDLSLPDAHGLETVARLRERCPLVPLVVLSGLDDERIAIEALKVGAQDYLVKGGSDGHLITRAIRYAIERKRAEMQLIEAKERAEAGSRAKSEFLANMSHELRTPLNAIIGFSELISDAKFGPLSARYREYAEDIRASGEHLLAVINDVLDLSKIEAGCWELHEEPVDLSALVADCCQLLKERADKGDVDVARNVTDHCVVMGDKTRLRQILLNLLSNAVKFAPGGQVVVSACALPSGEITVSVTDTGIGMSAEEIEIALQPFGQVDSALCRRFEGTGLGLPLAKRLIELHGGRADINSAPGHGTTVRILLPAGRTIISQH
jgi:signal transduction histidine kinase